MMKSARPGLLDLAVCTDRGLAQALRTPIVCRVIMLLTACALPGKELYLRAPAPYAAARAGTYGSARASTTQAIRTNLLAKATVATFVPRRACTARIQRLNGSALCAA